MRPVQASRCVNACAPSRTLMSRSLLHLLNPVRRLPLNKSSTAGRYAKWLGLSLAPVVLACRTHATQGDAVTSVDNPSSPQKPSNSSLRQVLDL